MILFLFIKNDYLYCNTSFLQNDLRPEFPGISGFSRRNVFCMREFYLLYRDDKGVQPVIA